MQKHMMFVAAFAVVAAAQAQVALDGVAEPIYGPAISVQNTQTQFGDSTA